MYDRATRLQALALHASGLSLSQVSRATGISRAAIRSWTERIEPLPGMTAECPVPRSRPLESLPRADYSYLLGLYLGDGCISHVSKGVYSLRISCADAWPGLIDACADAMSHTLPTSRVGRTQCPGCTSVCSYSKHWPCLFPQHGPGKKHTRPIALEPWQQSVVDEHPWALVRGLIHSDGSRTKNWAQRTVGGTTRRHNYTRYEFGNRSDDIRRIFTNTLTALGVDWRQPSAWNISVARKASVALMDEHVGPKY